MNNNFNGRISGIGFAKDLHEKGYTNLYLFSGMDFVVGEIPSYLKVISKTDNDKFLSLVEEENTI